MNLSTIRIKGMTSIKGINSSRYAASARTPGRRNRGYPLMQESKAHAVYFWAKLTDIETEVKGTKMSKRNKNFDRRKNCPNTKKATDRLLKQEKKEAWQRIAQKRKVHELPILEFIQGCDEPDSPTLGDEEKFGTYLEYESEDYGGKAT